MNIIGDVAGQYEAFIRLIAKMPKEEILCVGDLVDRGPKSRDLIEYCMKENIQSLRGNHEDMMLDYILGLGKYGENDEEHPWLYNGGHATLDSYEGKVDPAHLFWMTELPDFYREGPLLVTHAPVSGTLPKWEDCLKDDKQFEYGTHVLWCRQAPRDRVDEGVIFQVFGHNSHWGLTWFGTVKNQWAVGIDDSRKKVLTGLHYPSLTIYQESWV